MEDNTIYNIIAAVILAGVGLIPALVFYNMIRPMKKHRYKQAASGMDMKVRGVALPDEDDNDKSDLGSSVGRW